MGVLRCRQVVAGLECCARFLHALAGIGNRGVGGSHRASAGTRILGCFYFCHGGRDRGRRRCDRSFGGDTRGGFAVGGQFGGGLRPFQAVERVVEREPVVALFDGESRVLERLVGGVEFVGGVAVGAGGPSGLDRTARLLNLSVGRIAAARNRCNQQDDCREQDTRTRRHPSKYTRFAFHRSTMKDLSPDDRPREKLLRHGAPALGDNELVALVLGSGVRGSGALRLANELLQVRSGVHGLARSSSADLARVPGIGPAKAAQLLAALELGRRLLAHAPGARVQLRTPRDAAAYLMPAFGSRSVEHFGIVLLDTKHRVLRTSIVASGTMNKTVVEPRDVFREGLLSSAASLLVFHNHPSGDPTPSPDDVQLTRRLVSAGQLIGIDLVDHIVLGDGRYCSFKEIGQL